MTQEDLQFFGQSDLKEAERLKSDLVRDNIPLTLFFNATNCRGGCSPSVEVWAAREHFPDIVNKLAHYQSLRLAGLNFNPEQCEAVFDPEQPTAQCPACGHEFATSLAACPDCGLTFLAEAPAASCR